MALKLINCNRFCSKTRDSNVQNPHLLADAARTALGIVKAIKISNPVCLMVKVLNLTFFKT